MSDGVIVLDHTGRIYDYNPAAESIITGIQTNLAKATRHLIGNPLAEVLSSPELAAHFKHTAEFHYETTFPNVPNHHAINMHISPLLNKSGKLLI